MNVVLPSFRTDATDELCKDIAKRSRGLCFLGFSRGKDSLCAWLQLKRYFKTVIPFHCASVPCLRHVKDTLDYYERAMETRILRLVGPELHECLAMGAYQTVDDLEELESLDKDTFSMLDLLEYLRYEFNYPKAWCAFGIQASDSIDRRIYCNRINGRNPQNLTFYPCWDWPRAEVIKAVRESGLMLSGEYRYVNRTMGGPPSATCNAIYKSHYPEDWERIQALFPLGEAKTLRELYLDRAFERRRAAGIVADDDELAAKAEEAVADEMPDISGGEEA